MDAQMLKHSAKVLSLYPESNVRPANPAWRLREMIRDIQSLQELANELQHIQAPLRQASDALINACAPDTQFEVELKLGTLGALVTALGASMDTLVEAMTMHHWLAADDARIH